MTLTNEDLKNIKDLMEITIDDACEGKLVTKDDVKYLPTKDEFYKETLEIRKDLKDIHEELTVLSHHSSNHEDRLDKIEGRLQIKPSFA